MQYSFQALVTAKVNYSRQLDAAAHSASFILIFPLIFIVTIIGYQKYRNRVLRHQVKMLEQVWQIKSSKTS